MKIGRNEKCPCGSGKKYKVCCLAKGEEWNQIPLNDEMREILNKENLRFKEIMGRDIKPDEPLLPSTLQMGEETYKELSSAMLAEVGVAEDIIYAFNKLGFCLVKGYEDNYSEEQLNAWDEAIEEFHEMKSNGPDSNEDNIPMLLGNLEKHFDKLKFLLALILHKYSGKTNEIRLSGDINMHDYVAYCITRNLKTLEAIKVLLDQHFGEDGMALTRSNFENYLEIVFIIHEPNLFKDYFHAKEGVIKGTHIDKHHEIEEVHSGKTIKRISNFKKAAFHKKYSASNKKIYGLLYDQLSSFTHPDLRTIGNYIDKERGFSHLTRNLVSDCLIITLMVNCMTLEEIKDLESFSTSRDDILVLLQDLSSDLKRLSMEKEVNLPEVLVERIKVISTNCG